jgi:hypothetical protein
MAPPKIFPLLDDFYPSKITIFPMLFSQVNTVSTIFLDIPRMVIMAVPIVISPIVILSADRPWGDQNGSGE